MHQLVLGDPAEDLPGLQVVELHAELASLGGVLEVFGGDIPGGMDLAIGPVEPNHDGGGNVGELTLLENQWVLVTAKPKSLSSRAARIDGAAVFSTNHRASLEITPGPDPASQA